MSKKRAKHNDVPEIMSKKRVKQKVSKNTKTMDKIEAMKFKEKATYTQQEIDALRIEWAEYVDDFIPIDETLD
ncbi:hypothetical protein C1H46_030704 [Malus baccata]|uniref:Uncharacterized protein n=1 Tax=Malus baccata TaxID=106549 RepID=A0A540LB98_MALBA|nr:hypothetical protein C1H46_030704 [Malus baccata]